MGDLVLRRDLRRVPAGYNKEAPYYYPVIYEVAEANPDTHVYRLRDTQTGVASTARTNGEFIKLYHSRRIPGMFGNKLPDDSDAEDNSEEPLDNLDIESRGRTAGELQPCLVDRRSRRQNIRKPDRYTAASQISFQRASD